MAVAIVEGKINQVTTAAITDVVTTAGDGYIVKVHNPGYAHVGFSIVSTAGITANGVDSVLWLQGLVLNHDQSIAANCDDATNKGACLITTEHQAAVGSAAWEAVTSGAAAAITVNISTTLYTQAMATSHAFVGGHYFGIKIRGDAGANSWTAGTLAIMPLAFGGRK